MLWRAAAEEGDSPFVDRAYELVGGQPYLLQQMMSSVASVDDPERETAFEEATELLRSGRDDHFGALFGRVLAEPALKDIVSRLVRDGAVPNEPANRDFRYLQVLGIARREGNQLLFRNHLYAEFAQGSPQLTATQDAGRAGTTLVVPLDGACAFMRDAELAEIALSSYRGAVTAYNAGNYRLALAGFGAALEAVLLEWLESISSTELAAKVTAASGADFRGRERRNNPATWRLVNMMTVARAAPSALVGAVNPHEALREWRNLVHPAEARRQYRREDELEAEARGASALLEIALREVARIHT